jgi:hypothetical protein
MVAAEDHRYEEKPRPAMNLDIVRRLAVADTAQAARNLIATVSEKFGGFSRLKCLPDLAAAGDRVFADVISLFVPEV